MLGCLLGYVSGGILGRVLDQAIGVVEKRVDRRSPARFVAGTLGAIAGSHARPRARPARRVVRAGAVRGLGGRPGVVDLRLRRLTASSPVRARPCSSCSASRRDRSCAAQAFDARDGLFVDTSVVMDGQLLPLTRAGVLERRPHGRRASCSTRCRDSPTPTDDVKRRRARRGLETLDVLAPGRTRAPLRARRRVPGDPRGRRQAHRARPPPAAATAHERRSARRATRSCKACPRRNLRKLAQELTPSIGPGDYVRVALDA